MRNAHVYFLWQSRTICDDCTDKVKLRLGSKHDRESLDDAVYPQGPMQLLHPCQLSCAFCLSSFYALPKKRTFTKGCDLKKDDHDPHKLPTWGIDVDDHKNKIEIRGFGEAERLRNIILAFLRMTS